MDYTQNFSGLATDYAKGRPAYPDKLIEQLYLQYGLNEKSVIADIGSGTGKFAKLLLKRKSLVYCVEPNDDMRNVAVRELGDYENFREVNGTATDTTLLEKSVDFVTVAQAFHWFDSALFKRECKRILRKDGLVFLIWNMRDMEGEINQRSFRLFSEHCPKFKGFSGGIEANDDSIKEFFDYSYEYFENDNPLVYDRDKFISRYLSSSYSLKKGDTDYDLFIASINELFDEYEKDGLLTVENKTVVYVGTVE